MPSTRSLSHSQAVVMMVVAALLWSIAGVVTRQLESAVRFEVTFWRSAFNALSLLLILPLWRASNRSAHRVMSQPAPVARRSALAGWLHRHWGLLPEAPAFWVSGLCWSVMFTAFMVGLTFTSVANVLIIMAIGPLLTALLSRVVSGQTLAWRVWITIVVAGLGMAYMYGGQMLALMASDEAQAHNLIVGSLIALGVPVAAAINWTVVQRSQNQGERIDLVPSVLLGAVISSLATLPLAFPFAATGSDIAWLALLGLCQLAIPCMLAVTAARVLKAPEVSLLALLEVVFGILWPWLWANEAPGSEVLTGGSVVLSALVINELLGWRSRAEIPRIQVLEAEAARPTNPPPSSEKPA
ncbi:DMT family transporter [Hydrogenophaga sp.]|uniref:DMT family transporter n=1 Tax=Hydrogenophaga sp. TaxID=1904254 RepID=UPI0025B84A3D|nr:DMT family transporter [Hydrogenophaga sp.]